MSRRKGGVYEKELIGAAGRGQEEGGEGMTVRGRGIWTEEDR